MIFDVMMKRLHSVALIARFVSRRAITRDVKDHENLQEKMANPVIQLLLVEIRVALTFHRTEHHGSPKQGFPGKCTRHRAKSLQFSLQKLLPPQISGKTSAAIDKTGKSCGEPNERLCRGGSR
jgi:hypothetical protein